VKSENVFASSYFREFPETFDDRTISGTSAQVSCGNNNAVVFQPRNTTLVWWYETVIFGIGGYDTGYLELRTINLFFLACNSGSQAVSPSVLRWVYL